MPDDRLIQFSYGLIFHVIVNNWMLTNNLKEYNIGTLLFFLDFGELYENSICVHVWSFSWAIAAVN